MENSENRLAFEMRETVATKIDEPILEMIDITAKPEIFVNEADDLVNIVGSLHVQGQYVKNSVLNEEVDLPTITHSIEIDNRMIGFSHRFPLEITINADRVKDIDALAIELIKFDYEIPSSDRLSLTAHLVIAGVDNEQVVAIINEQAEEDKVIEDSDTAESIEEDNLEEIDRNEPIDIPEKQTIDITMSDKVRDEDDEAVTESFLNDLFTEADDSFSYTVYLVQENDTLDKIAERFKLSPTYLISTNRLSDGTLTVGQSLKVIKQQTE